MEKVQSEHQVTDWSSGVDGGATGMEAEEVLGRGC